MWKKFKKTMSTFICFILCLGVFLCFGNFLKSLHDNEKEPITIPTSGTLNYRLANVTGTMAMDFTEEIELSLLDKAPTVLGADGLQEIVIDGHNVGVINAKGGKRSVIQAPKGGTITFKNLTLNDKTDNSLGAWQNYLHFLKYFLMFSLYLLFLTVFELPQSSKYHLF